MAYCLERVDTDLPSNSNAAIDINTNEGKLPFKAKQDNNYTIAYLQAAMEDDDDMITMLEASTDEWPNGIAHEAMKKLQDKYEPTDFVTMVERTKAIEDIKMGKNESREKMFLALNMINHRFKNRLPPLKDNELLSIVMAKVPSKYTTILAVESVRLGSAFSVKEARSALMTLYRAGSREDDDDNDAEVALNVNFKCYECGKRPQSK